MKHLKLYETYMEMYLDDDDQLILMTEYINEEDSVKIKKILDNGFDPNTKWRANPIIFKLQDDDKNKSNAKILKLFIDAGLDKYTITKFLYDELSWIKLNTDKLNILEIVRICVKAGADLYYDYGTYNGLFKMIEQKNLTNNAFNEKFVDEILDIIAKEAPEQYKEYLIKKTANKFNI